MIADREIWRSARLLKGMVRLRNSRAGRGPFNQRGLDSIRSGLAKNVQRVVMRLLIAAILAFGLSAAAHADSGKYWVQIAATPTQAAAAGRLAEIVQRNAKVREAQQAGRIVVYKHIDKRGEFWRVRIGPFDDHEQARQFCGQLRTEGQSCLAVS